tara:strand:+ start:1471 stop:1884 length:414 start_codon:yes stop_codon:yes gene_type:complete
MSRNSFFKNFIISFAVIGVVVSCATPRLTYDQKELNDRHYDKVDPSSLNCKQLNETRIQVSTLINDIAERLLSGNTEANSNMFAGIGTQNPEVGENFFGFKSSETPRELNEYRELKLVLEQIEDLQVLKCTRTSLDQ